MYKYVAVDMYATIFTIGGCNSINSRMRGNKRPQITWFIGHIVRRKKTKNEEGMEGLSFCFPVWLLTTVEWAGKDTVGLSITRTNRETITRTEYIDTATQNIIKLQMDPGEKTRGIFA